LNSRRIEEITSAIIDYRGRTPPKAKDGVKLLTAKVIKDGAIDETRLEYISDEAVARFTREILTTQPRDRSLRDFGGIRPRSADEPGSYRLCDGETVVSHLQEVVDRADEAPLA
jgi:hypothetical protein